MILQILLNLFIEQETTYFMVKKVQITKETQLSWNLDINY